MTKEERIFRDADRILKSFNNSKTSSIKCVNQIIRVLLRESEMNKTFFKEFHQIASYWESVKQIIYDKTKTP